MWEQCLEETRLSHSDVLAQAVAKGCVWVQGSAALGVSEDVCGPLLAQGVSGTM